MQIPEKIKTVLVSDDNIRFAYLFGSFADGTQTAGSDIDIAVYFDKDTLDRELETILSLSRATDRKIDLTVLNRTKNLYLLHEIFHKGILLKDGEDRAFFEVTKEHEYLDYKYFKRVSVA